MPLSMSICLILFFFGVKKKGRGDNLLFHVVEIGDDLDIVLSNLNSTGFPIQVLILSVGECEKLGGVLT